MVSAARQLVIRDHLRNIAQTNIGVPLLLLAMLAMMTLPVPTLLLDLLFTFNIALALIVLLVAVYALRPLEFAVFPTVLLVATLLRLALNVASTRVVLLEGHAGGAAAGNVIQSFGEVVVRGNYVVGLVVFIILVIINFVVVTKGAGRISEVSARFTLDAMPGKQMAIDADLNAGSLTQEEAKDRRDEVGREADFYGAMDGASKFVRGDAVAGILILVINIVGGLGIGMGQHDLSFSTALENYTLLTIGDGLVAQIPSLLLSVAAAIMVTRVNTSKEVGEQISDEMLTDPRALAVASGILVIMGVIPGMPHMVFLTLAAIVGAGAWWCRRKAQLKDTVEEVEVAEAEAIEAEAGAAAPAELGWQDVHTVDLIGLEVGYRLLSLVDKNQGGELLSRIKGVRKKLSLELGFLLPTVHIRDNLELLPNNYRITLMGVTVGESEVYPDRALAIDPGEVYGVVEGIATTDPAFGLPATWITEDQKEHAQSVGYTVVDAATVIATHLNHVMQLNAADLIGHDDAEQLLERLRESAPKLVDELVPDAVALGGWLKVLQNLLRERVPIRDLRSIAEAVIDAAHTSKDPDTLTSAARIRLGRLIVQTIYGNAEELSVITLDPELETLLSKNAGAGGVGGPTVEPNLLNRLQASLAETASAQEAAGKPAVLVVSDALRAIMASFCKFGKTTLHVLSYNELPDDKQIAIVASIGAQ